MSTWIRRCTAAAVATVAGMLFAVPAVAAPPPAEVDSRVFLYHEKGQEPVSPGGTVTYVMTAAGVPENVPQHRTVVLELPQGVTFRSAGNPLAAGPCTPDATGHKVTCTTQDPVDQHPASDAAWWVTTDYADDLPIGEYVTAKATLTTEIPDPDPANNVYTTDVFVSAPGDMSVTISAPPGPWPVGASFDAKISVHNAGPYRSPAGLRTVVEPLSLRYRGWPEGCGADPGVMYCTVPPVEAGATYSFTVRFTVAEFETDPIVLSPEIDPVAPDTDPANNKATYRSTITKAPASATPSPTPTGGGTAAGDPTLPITGPPAAALTLAALTLLLTGAAILLTARRRA